MAIKSSWSAGEVLLAADLTDTLANKAGLTPSSSQTITAGTATVKPLILRAASGQTANLLEFQNSAGTAVRAVLPDGTITGQNLLYNGAMQVAQRGTSTAGITGGFYYTVDRYAFSPVTMGTWTMDVQSDAPTGSGFRRSTRLLCTTADTSPAAGDLILFYQALEGQDLQRIGKGTSAANSLTLSFWVKSNVTGTYIAELSDVDNARSVSSSYSVSASNTWEKKTITFPPDLTGAFDNDNSSSLGVHFWLGAGSSYTSGTLATTWGTITNANRAVGQVNLASAINNAWQVTGVQLEVGPVASAFEFKSFGQELRECQRYLPAFGGDSGDTIGSGWSAGTTVAYAVVRFPVTARTAPTGITVSSAGHWGVVYGGSIETATAISFGVGGKNGAQITLTTAGNLTSNQGIGLRCTNASGSILFTGCEL